MHKEINEYNSAHEYKDVSDLLAQEIARALPSAECKVWHGSPVWFIEGNPIVGYSAQKGALQLLFWSGQTFDEPLLTAQGSFKAAEARFSSAREVTIPDLKRWLKKAEDIQWDYKNIVKRKGELLRLK